MESQQAQSACCWAWSRCDAHCAVRDVSSFSMGALYARPHGQIINGIAVRWSEAYWLAALSCRVAVLVWAVLAMFGCLSGPVMCSCAPVSVQRVSSQSWYRFPMAVLLHYRPTDRAGRDVSRTTAFFSRASSGAVGSGDRANQHTLHARPVDSARDSVATTLNQHSYKAQTHSRQPRQPLMPRCITRHTCKHATLVRCVGTEGVNSYLHDSHLRAGSAPLSLHTAARKLLPATHPNSRSCKPDGRPQTTRMTRSQLVHAPCSTPHTALVCHNSLTHRSSHTDSTRRPASHRRSRSCEPPYRWHCFQLDRQPTGRTLTRGSPCCPAPLLLPST